MAGPLSDLLSGTTVPPEPEGLTPPVDDKNTPLSDLLNRRADPTQSLNLAVETNPDEAAKNKGLAQSLGLPLETIAVDPITAERELQKRMINESLRDSPITKEWISDPEKAILAQDSTKELSLIEKLWTKPITYFPFIKGPSLSETVPVVAEGGRAVASGIAGILTNLHELVIATDELMGLENPQHQIVRDKLLGFQDVIRGDQENINPMVTAGLESAGQTIPFLLTGPVGMLTSAGGLTFGSSYRQAREEGAGPGKAATFGLVQGVIEIATEKLPIDTLFKSLKVGDSLFKNLMKQMLTEVPSEQVATAAQDMSEWLFLHPDKTIQDYLNERPQAALETAIATVVGATLQTSVAHLGQQYAKKLQQSKNAQNFGVRLETTQKELAATPLAGRDPATAIDHLASVMRQNGTNEIWLSIDGITKLADKLEISPFEAADKLGLRAEFEQQYMRGGDIRLTPDQLGVLMLSENWNTLRGSFRETEDSMTTDEGEEYEKSGLKEELEEAIAPLEEGITVYHGSYSAKFEEFDKEKIGTGTGVAGRGTGIYVTENKILAEFFKHVETDIDLSNLPDDIKARYGQSLEEVTKLIDDIQNQTDLSQPEFAAKAGPLFKRKDEIVKAISAEMKKRLGYLYEAKFNAKREELLNWDAPNEKFEGRTGADVFTELQTELGSEKDASDFLAGQGIVGIQYLDPEGKPTYVVFDTSRLTIIKRNEEVLNTVADLDVLNIEKEMGVDGLFRTAEEAGMTPDEYMFYLADLNRAHDAAVVKQNEKLLKDAQRKVSKEYKKLRKEAEQEVKAALETLPIYKIINSLSITDDRIDREALAALLGDEKWLKTLPKLPNGKPIYTDKGKGGGLDPSALAEAYGYPSATDMIMALGAAKDLNEAVKETTDALMKQRYPDLTDQKQRLDSAMEAITNDAHTELLVQELNILRQQKADKQKQKEQNKALKEAGVEKKSLTQAQKDALKKAAKIRNIKLKVLKAAVKKQLDVTAVGEIDPRRFAKAVRDFGKKAGKALRNGDIDSAIDFKFKQTVNFIMAQQAYKVKAEAEKQNKYLQKFLNTKSAPKIGTDFIETVKQIIGNYNLGPKLSAKKKKKLQDWVAKKTSEGGIFQIPARLLADANQHWATMPLAEWRQLVDAVKNIEAQGRNAKVIGKLDKEVDFEHAKARLLSAANAIPDTARAANKQAGKVERTRDKAAAGLSYVDSALVKVENLLRFLDGGSVGEWYKRMFQPTSEAQTQKLDMVTQKVVPLVQKIGKWPKINKRRLEKKVFVRPLGQEMTYSQLLMLALNSGNVSNLEKVVEGHNSTLPKDFRGNPQGNVWTAQGVMDAMALLSPVEGKWVQEVWDYLESLRPAVAAVYEAENGHVAQKIETRPLTIGGVSVKGGYFPMMYEYAPSHENALGALQDPFIRASVYSGMTKERTGFVAPVDLNLQNLLPALERNIHFITHYRAVRDNLRILQDNDLVTTIRNKLGEEYVQELKNWTSAIASGNTLGHTPTYVDKTIEFFRRGVTASVLGLSWTTGVSQLFGYSSSIAALGRSGKGESFSSARGTKYMAIGAWKYLWEKNSVKQAMLLSGELRHRIANTDRELGEALRSVRYKYGPSGVASKTYNWWNKMALTTISGIQTYSVDIPTWIGAFNQGLDDGLSTEDAVQHADSILRTSQGTGHVKDLSAIQRRKGVMRALTMFSTYSLVLYNMQREAGLAGKKFPISSFSRMMWAVLVPTLMDAALRSDFGPDDDEEETWAEWLAKKTAAYSARSIPLIGTGFASYMEGYSYRASPLEAVPVNLKKAGDAVYAWTQDETESNWELAQALVLGLGTTFGIGGTTQASRFIEALDTDDATLQDYLIGPRDEE